MPTFGNQEVAKTCRATRSGGPCVSRQATTRAITKACLCTPRDRRLHPCGHRLQKSQARGAGGHPGTPPYIVPVPGHPLNMFVRTEMRHTRHGRKSLSRQIYYSLTRLWNPRCCENWSPYTEADRPHIVQTTRIAHCIGSCSSRSSSRSQQQHRSRSRSTESRQWPSKNIKE